MPITSSCNANNLSHRVVVKDVVSVEAKVCSNREVEEPLFW